MFIPPFKLEKQVLMIARNNLLECNSSQWINWETTPDGETKFTIRGGLFRPVLSPRHKRSSLHYLGIGTLIFQWEERVHDLPQWYVITNKTWSIKKIKEKYSLYP